MLRRFDTARKDENFHFFNSNSKRRPDCKWFESIALDQNLCFGGSTLREEMKISTFSIRTANEGSIASGLKSIVLNQNYCFGDLTLREKMKTFTLSIQTANEGAIGNGLESIDLDKQ